MSYFSYKEDEAFREGRRDAERGRYGGFNHDEHFGNDIDKAYYDGRHEYEREETRRMERYEEERHEEERQMRREQEHRQYMRDLEEQEYCQQSQQEYPEPEYPEFNQEDKQP